MHLAERERGGFAHGRQKIKGEGLLLPFPLYAPFLLPALGLVLLHFFFFGLATKVRNLRRGGGGGKGLSGYDRHDLPLSTSLPPTIMATPEKKPMRVAIVFCQLGGKGGREGSV